MLKSETKNMAHFVDGHIFFTYLFHNMLGNTINKDEITQSNDNIAESLARPHLSQSFQGGNLKLSG